ncbi:hypothetical protein scyTo_0025092, partial [Scyliorhinus torazame]|nr:hypothetical protein [Scyliorhinus torazame]
VLDGTEDDCLWNDIAEETADDDNADDEDKEDP